MSYFRKIYQAKQCLEMIGKGQKWLIPISADPDSMAASMALKRILKHKGAAVDIARINDIARPDNLAMIRYTRLHMLRFTPSMLKQYTHFAAVDSQPSHHPEFEGVKFSIIIDHHPVSTEPESAFLQDIRPEYGAASTIMTEYLYNLDVRPGVRLATALQFGIRTDTLAFQRHVSEVDLRAYQFLGKFADASLLQRIMYKEFHLDWLYYFAKGINKLRKAGGGHYIFMDKIESPDILALLADFFMRVYEIRWIAVAGLCEKQVIISLRSDGMAQDVGRRATLQFNELGSAGGHKTMARAEFSKSAVTGDDNVENFIYKRLLRNLPPEEPKKTPETPQQ